MTLGLCSLASGSSGNCYVVASETTKILVDAGISGKQISERLCSLNMTTLPDAVLITHEHSDHIKGLNVLAKKGAKIFANEKTLEAVYSENLPAGANIIATGQRFAVGDIEVTSFPLSHDAADPSGYSFCKDGKCISIITDTGYVTPECFSFMQKADILVLEANHDVSMLRIGRYPWFLKQRILSNEGHLSNEAAAEALAQVLQLDLMTRGCVKNRQVLLAHLSKENNFPEMAMATVNNILESRGFCTGRETAVETLKRDSISPIYTI